MILALAGWIGLALISNDRFSVAAQSSFLQIGSTPTALAEAREAISNSLQAQTPSPSETFPPRESAALSKTAPQPEASRPSGPAPPSSRPVSQSTATPGPGTPPSSGDGNERKLKTEEIIKEITRRAENEGDINSISARGLLMERAWLSYRHGPFFGQGLAAAHALQPHNTFLLFAVAFGDLGWIVPLAFLGLTAYSVRSVQQLPLCLATFTVMMTSHDLPFTFGLLVPFILGVAGLNAQRYRSNDPPDAVPAIRYAAVVTPVVFVIGAISTLTLGPSSIAGTPKLLLFLVSCAIALWSAGIWHWHKELFPRGHALARGREWD
jgi:hypothetical protein